MLAPETRDRDFPSLKNRTYLNTAAEGIPSMSVGLALQQYARDKQLGMDGRDLHFAEWEAAKQLVGNAFGLSAEEVTICSCSSEAFNLLAAAMRLKPGDEVIINDLDFPAGSTPWLQADSPATVKVWKARDWALRGEDLVPLLGPKTRLVTTSLVSFFNGAMIPLPEVIRSVREHSDALLALDVTQALGRVPLDLQGVDWIVSSTHKWILASHGGGLVGVPQGRAQELTVPAGGWFNLQDAFGAARFEQAISRAGAAGFTVGMPNFPAVYAIRAALQYITQVGIDNVDRAAAPLVRACLEGVRELPVELITPPDQQLAGIVAFRHEQAARIQQHLHERDIHIMSQAGRLRVSLHGYNCLADVERLLSELAAALAAL